MSRTLKLRVEHFLFGLLLALAIFVVGPTLLGYVWAVGWLPAYGAQCRVDNVFGSAVSPNGYRIYLLGWGCDLDTAVRKIVAASHPAVDPDSKIDPSRIAAIYEGRERAESPDESLTMEVVVDSLRTFDGSEPNDCRVTENCPTSEGSSDFDIERLARAYRFYARSHFLDAVDDGADSIAWMLRQGIIVVAIICLFYLLTALALAIVIIHPIGKRFKRARTSRK
jgi:hypothetical protein